MLYLLKLVFDAVHFERTARTDLPESDGDVRDRIITLLDMC